MDVRDPLKGEKDLDTAAVDCSANTDDVLCYVTYVLFEYLHTIILKCDIYSESQKWSDLLQYVPEHGHLPQVFQDLPYSVVAVFRVTRPSPPKRSVTELDTDGMAVS